MFCCDYVMFLTVHYESIYDLRSPSESSLSPVYQKLPISVIASILASNPAPERSVAKGDVSRVSSYDFLFLVS